MYESTFVLSKVPSYLKFITLFISYIIKFITFVRVKLEQNTRDAIDTISQQVGLDIAKDCLLPNGQGFSDHVQTRSIEPRGVYDGEIKFAKDEDRHRPICKKPYRLAPDESRFVAEQLREMIARGTTRPSSSPWGTPVFVVPKAGGGWRLCCDYRDLNSKLLHEAYMPPAVDQIFDQLLGAMSAPRSKDLLGNITPRACRPSRQLQSPRFSLANASERLLGT